ncbi:MAG: ABC transporter permease [Planctomycetota bacterium]|jgi:ABC-2 type transport system permease protein
MLKIIKVAHREYFETVKTKTFIFSVFMAPLIVVGIIFFASRSSPDKTGPRSPFKVAISDFSKELLDDLKASFDNYNNSNTHRQIQLQILDPNQSDPNEFNNQHKDRLRRGHLDMYIVIEKDVISGPGRIRLYTYKTRASNFNITEKVKSRCKQTVRNLRYQSQNISQEVLETIRRPVKVDEIEISSSDTERVKNTKDKIRDMMLPFAFMYLMFFGIFVNGQQMLTSIIEEKSSRIIEVLLSAVSPFELMTGKILGLISIGLSVVILWGAAAYAGAQYKGFDLDIGPQIILCFVIYYILGFILFNSILAGIGSICNSLKEAQSLMMPVTLIFIIPLLSWLKIVQNPDGLLSRVLSFIPPVTPMVMILRMAAGQDLPITDIIISTVILAISIIFVMWISSKIFRTGILMYGKRPSLREIVRWLKQS